MDDAEPKRRNHFLAGTVGGLLLPLAGLIVVLACWQQGDEAAARQVAVASMLGILAYFVVGAPRRSTIGADAAHVCVARSRTSRAPLAAPRWLRPRDTAGVTPSKPIDRLRVGLTDYPKEAEGESEGRGQGRPSGMARDGR